MNVTIRVNNTRLHPTRLAAFVTGLLEADVRLEDLPLGTIGCSFEADDDVRLWVLLSLQAWLPRNCCQLDQTSWSSGDGWFPLADVSGTTTRLVWSPYPRLGQQVVVKRATRYLRSTNTEPVRSGVLEAVEDNRVMVDGKWCHIGPGLDRTGWYETFTRVVAA